MSTENNKIDIFALTDCHQEARKLCCLFSNIIESVPQRGKNTLICDCGDLFKGIYDRQICVDSYLKLRNELPEAKIVLAIGNNDFGFNLEQFKFLQSVIAKFNQANIHVLCANLVDVNTGQTPDWVDPYILLEINHKKFLITAFCINQIRLQKYGISLIDIPEAFIKLKNVIKHIEPDALIILNHALYESSEKLTEEAKNNGIDISLLIGGHEHSVVKHNFEQKIFYPQAFSKTMLHFSMDWLENKTNLRFINEINSKGLKLKQLFKTTLDEYEEKNGLNIPIAHSTLNLEKNYSEPCSLGTFIADNMKNVAKTKIGFISTGYTSHALRYEENKILTRYNLERAFSAEVYLQTVCVHPSELKEVLTNAIKYRYIQKTGNVRFLQCSQNVTIICKETDNHLGKITQIFINGEPLLDENYNPLHDDEYISCAVDPFVGAGEQGFDVLKHLPKETLMKNNQLVKIKDIFTREIKESENKYRQGSGYPTFKIIDEK